jgi:predicted nucleic acid-binding protein
MTPRPVAYVDTSALAALVIDQPFSLALLGWLDEDRADLVSSDLLETELRRIAVREGLDQADVTQLLDRVALAPLDRAAFRSAGLLPMQSLRTLHALHLEAALRLDVTGIITYHRRLGEAAQAVGLEVIAPGIG